MVFRVSPHRHSQSLSRDVPSTIRLPSAIIPENDDEKDDEKSTKKEIEEDLNIFCRRRLKSCRVLLAFLVQSEVLLLLFSCAKGGETCVISDSLCRSLRSTKDAIFLFFAGFLGF